MFYCTYLFNVNADSTLEIQWSQEKVYSPYKARKGPLRNVRPRS